jgi:uncharacterized membrane protein YgcG
MTNAGIAVAASPLPTSPTRGEVLIETEAPSRPTHRQTPSPFVGRVGEGASRLLGAILLLLTLLFAAPVSAEEVISSFTTDIALRTDGTVDVTETIVVMAEGNQIRRGIFRDIPTILVNDDNSRLRSDLTVISVQRDGRAEPYSLEDLGSGFKRIRIGDANVFLNYGRHSYTIRYTMTRMGRFFADHDELYWNATGNYWDFPIEQSVTTVTLPPGARVSQTAGYTGRVGSTEQAVAIARTSDDKVTFHTTRVLQPGEGVTVAVAFQKGILVEPQGMDALLAWISDHRDLVFPGIAVLLVLGYNLFAWSAVGRDPAKGTIIPLFHPPKGFSPSLAHFVNAMGWKNSGWTAFTAAIFDLGVKGLVTINNAGKALSVTVTNDRPNARLPAGEKVIYDYIAGKGTVKVDTTNGAKIHEKRAEFMKVIETENRATYFNNNTGYVLLGVALSIGLLLILVFSGIMDPIYLLVAFIGGIAIGVFTSLFGQFWRGSIVSKLIVLGWVVIAGGNFLGIGVSALSNIRLENGLIAAISIVIINVAFGVLMRAPTVQGRKVMDQLDGFKMYLETAEQNRLNYQGKAPEMTVSRFEQILPYAIALGVEKPWSEHFEGELSRHAVADASGDYQPSWYHSRGGWNSSSGSFAKTVSAATSGMAAAMIASQPVSSSSSGFSSGGGGGGSSGGGGGGGGGGGW